MGSQVLGRIIGNSVADGGEGGDDHVVQLHRGGIPRHDRGAEAVDDALDQDVSHGDEALLQDAGDGNHQDFFQKPAVEQGCLFLDGDFPESDPYGQDGQDAADSLA